MAENVRVAVRVRPFSRREKELGCSCVVSMTEQCTTVAGKPPKQFACDAAYWSHDPSAPNFASQEIVMDDIGNAILNCSLSGYNGCLFAYGQTGSGKTYSLLGEEDSPGIIPRTVAHLFEEKRKLEEDPCKQLRVWISYLEIYNDHLYDLLEVDGGEVRRHSRSPSKDGGTSRSPSKDAPPRRTRTLTTVEKEELLPVVRRARTLAAAQKDDSEDESEDDDNEFSLLRRAKTVTVLDEGPVAAKKKTVAAADSGQNLVIRDHPRFGVYVPGLNQVPCETPDEVYQLVAFGTRRRAMAATAMNDHSSRSHAVFVVRLQNLEGERPEKGEKDDRTELHSRINLIDLAGAERQSKVQAEVGGLVMKQGCAINKGLSALALVIKELSDRQARKDGSALKGGVPFRASKLTWLLKDSLAGNSKTHMLANISPASDNIAETLSTLRFAASVKTIKTTATQNKCTHDELVTSLKKELEALRAQVAGHPDGQLQLQEVERMIAEQTEDFKKQLEHAKMMQEARDEVLKDMAVSAQGIHTAFGVDKMTPYLLNMARCTSLAGCLLYYLPEGEKKTVGSGDENTIRVSALGIPKRLCVIENVGNIKLIITKCSDEGRVLVNGVPLEAEVPRELQDGARLYLGHAMALRVAMPALEDERADDRNLLLQDLDEEWQAVEDSPACAGTKEFLGQLLEQMPPEAGKVLCEEMRVAARLCDEATDITRLCKPKEGMRFEVRLTSGSPTSVIVSVLGAQDGDAPVYLWTSDKMAERLDRMRDCYQVFTRTGRFDVDPLDDPWREADPVEIWARMRELEVRLEDAQAQHHRARAVAWGVLLWNGRSEQGIRIVFRAWQQVVLRSRPLARPSAATSRPQTSPRPTRPGGHVQVQVAVPSPKIAARKVDKDKVTFRPRSPLLSSKATSQVSLASRSSMQPMHSAATSKSSKSAGTPATQARRASAPSHFEKTSPVVQGSVTTVGSPTPHHLATPDASPAFFVEESSPRAAAPMSPKRARTPRSGKQEKVPSRDAAASPEASPARVRTASSSGKQERTPPPGPSSPTKRVPLPGLGKRDASTPRQSPFSTPAEPSAAASTAPSEQQSPAVRGTVDLCSQIALLRTEVADTLVDSHEALLGLAPDPHVPSAGAASASSRPEGVASMPAQPVTPNDLLQWRAHLAAQSPPPVFAAPWAFQGRGRSATMPSTPPTRLADRFALVVQAPARPQSMEPTTLPPPAGTCVLSATARSGIVVQPGSPGSASASPRARVQHVVMRARTASPILYARHEGQSCPLRVQGQLAQFAQAVPSSPTNSRPMVAALVVRETSHDHSQGHSQPPPRIVRYSTMPPAADAAVPYEPVAVQPRPKATATPRLSTRPSDASIPSGPAAAAVAVAAGLGGDALPAATEAWLPGRATGSALVPNRQPLSPGRTPGDVLTASRQSYVYAQPPRGQGQGRPCVPMVPAGAGPPALQLRYGAVPTQSQGSASVSSGPRPVGEVRGSGDQCSTPRMISVRLYCGSDAASPRSAVADCASGGMASVPLASSSQWV